MINKILLIGNLGKDPELRHTESGIAVTSFSIATNESYKDKAGEWQNITEWHNVVTWRDLADRVAKLQKGNQVYVEGKLTHRKYTDKDGIERYVSEVVANTVRLLGSKPKEETGTPNEQYAEKAQPSSDPYDDLPF